MITPISDCKNKKVKIKISEIFKNENSFFQNYKIIYFKDYSLIISIKQNLEEK
jgi:hypothetical protein